MLVPDCAYEYGDRDGRTNAKTRIETKRLLNNIDDLSAKPNRYDI
jgi:hypothetical protein